MICFLLYFTIQNVRRNIVVLVILVTLCLWKHHLLWKVKQIHKNSQGSSQSQLVTPIVSCHVELDSILGENPTKVVCGGANSIICLP